MATSIDFIDFVCDQIRDVGEIRYKKCLVNIWFMLMISLFF